MAAGDLAAKRYAQAAFEIARERDELAAWHNAMASISAFLTVPDVKAAMEDARIPLDAKLRVAEQSLTDLGVTQLNFARILVRKGRIVLAAEIADEFNRLVEESEGIVRAIARTAVALSDAERGQLQQNLELRTGKRVLLETEVDPLLLGGLVVQIGDQLIDASTRARLSSLRESLVGAV